MPPSIQKLVEEGKDMIADLWRATHKIEGNNGVDVLYSVHNGIKSFNIFLDSFAEKIAKAVSDHIDLDNQCMKAYRLGEKAERKSWINQPANQHDERIRAARDAELIREIYKDMLNDDKHDLPNHIAEGYRMALKHQRSWIEFAARKYNVDLSDVKLIARKE